MPLGTGPNPNPKPSTAAALAADLATDLDLRIQPNRVILSLVTILKEAEVVHLIVWNHAWKFPSRPPLVLE